MYDFVEFVKNCSSHLVEEIKSFHLIYKCLSIF